MLCPFSENASMAGYGSKLHPGGLWPADSDTVPPVLQETQMLYDLNVLRKQPGEPSSPASSSSSGVGTTHRCTIYCTHACQHCSKWILHVPPLGRILCVTCFLNAQRPCGHPQADPLGAPPSRPTGGTPKQTHWGHEDVSALWSGVPALDSTQRGVHSTHFARLEHGWVHNIEACKGPLYASCHLRANGVACSTLLSFKVTMPAAAALSRMCLLHTCITISAGALSTLW